MSRMDRNKELHEKLAKEEQRANRKETIFARRETKASKKPNNPETFSQNDFEEQEYYTDYQEQPRSGANHYTNQNSIQRPKVVKGKNKGKQPAKKQPKPKKVKRKRSFLRFIIYLLIFLFAYSIVSS